MAENWLDHPQPSRAWVVVGGILLAVLMLLWVVSTPHEFNSGFKFAAAEVSSTDPDESDVVRRVELPHYWQRDSSVYGGSHRYRLIWPHRAPSMDRPKGADESQEWALLIPRVGARFRVMMDGDLVWDGYWGAEGYVDTAVVPHWIRLPAHFDPTLKHNLEIEVKGVPLRNSGLGPVDLAPAQQVRERYVKIYWWQVHLTWMVAACSAMLGLLAGLIWWVGRERLFAWMSIASMAWAIRLALTTLIEPQMPFELWFFLHKWSFTVYCGFLCLFMWELFRLGRHISLALIWVLLYVSPVVIGLIILTANYDGYRIWTGLFAVICFWTVVLMVLRSRKGLNSNQKLIIVVTVVTLITGLRDFLVVQLGFAGDADLRWMTPGSLVFMLSLSLVLVQRMSRYVAQIRTLNADLVLKVQQKEHELRDAFETIKESEKQKVLIAERARLTRDMHDGLGSQLVQTLNAVRSKGSMSMSEVEKMLEHALEELRMTLDSMEPMEGDLPTILGTLRQRISPGLESAGIVVEWEVQEMPALKDASGGRLETRGVMQLFRCLQEVFANVVKHSGATMIRVSTTRESCGVVLSIADNGRGMSNTGRSGGRGMNNILVRARSIGAEVEWIHLGKGTEVRFTFPHVA